MNKKQPTTQKFFGFMVLRMAAMVLTINVITFASFAPVAQAVTVFDIFPGIRYFSLPWFQDNELPVYEVAERVYSEQEILLQVCEERGYGEDCAKTLLGMMWKESLNTATAIGDNGLARGYFQIHYEMHHVTIECAENLRCSARWSLRYMEQNSYPEYKNYAVQCHNGCNANNGYAASALRHGERLWLQPIPTPKIFARK